MNVRADFSGRNRNFTKIDSQSLALLGYIADMREMDRKDFDLPFISKFILALSAVLLPTTAVFLISEFGRPAWSSGSLSWLMIVIASALVMTVWGARNGRRFLADAVTVTFTREAVEEKYFGLGKIPWSQVQGVIPEIQNIKGVDYKSLFLQLREPDVIFKRVSLYKRIFLPLRSWRARMVPLYFGAFNGRFEEAIEWIATYKPEISIQPPDSE